jgi:hypothetical protein
LALILVFALFSTVQMSRAAGFVFSNEEFLSKAPETGYQDTFIVTHKVNGPNYKPEQILRLNVRTRFQPVRPVTFGTCLGSGPLSFRKLARNKLYRISWTQ